MKKNLPVSNIEIPLEDDSLLVSRTDLKGRITSCNQEFIAISGFTEQELIGSPHNIVRHPDMPAAAFEDLWNTVQHGDGWKGLVKNRTRDGDYYWVFANVTPVIEAGKTVGYISVRTRAEPSQIKAAEALYRDVNSGKRAFPRTRGEHSNQSWQRYLGCNTAYGLFGAALLTQAGALAVHWLFDGSATLASGLTAAALLLGSAGLAIFRQQHGHEKSAAGVKNERLREKLEYVLSQAQKASQRIEAGVSEMEQKNAELQTRNENQISHLEQTRVSMEYLIKIILENAQDARKAEQLSNTARSRAEQGNQIMDNTIRAMDEIDASSQAIGNIISLIDDIAFQTNLLALNASVEAAHAGDQGKGFAVVATEVRNLAQRSATAANDIKRLIGDSSVKVRAGNQLVRSSDQQLNEIARSTSEMNTIVSAIAVHGEDQARRVKEVFTSIENMGEMTRQNSDLVASTNQANAFLRSQSGDLRELLEFFKEDKTPRRAA